MSIKKLMSFVVSAAAVSAFAFSTNASAANLLSGLSVLPAGSSAVINAQPNILTDGATFDPAGSDSAAGHGPYWNPAYTLIANGNVQAEYDMGSVKSFDSLTVAYVQAGNEGPLKFQIVTSNTSDWASSSTTGELAATPFVTYGDWSSSSHAGQYFFTNTDTYTFPELTGRYVRFISFIQGSNQGLNEVILSTSAVPEPATVGLLSLIGLTGLARRRGQR